MKTHAQASERRVVAQQREMSSASASSHLLQRPSGAEQHLRQHEDRLLRVQLVADLVQAASQAKARQNLPITIKLRN